MRTNVSLLVLGAIFLGACGSSSSDPATTCGSGGPLSGPGGEFNGPFIERSYSGPDGVARKWLLRLPRDYQPGEPTDVIFNFHGSGSNADAQLVYGDLTEQADRDRIILVVPDGNKIFPERDNPLANYWDSAWEANLRVRDFDVDYVLDLVETVKAEYCTADFQATGMSAGGDMVSALQCLEESPFSSFAPVTYMYYNEAECGAAPPRPLIYFHGDADFVVPIQGSGPPWNDPPVAEAMAAWASHNGCRPGPLEDRISNEVLRYHWEGCAAATEWYLIEGGGHTWPGAFDAGLGYTTQDISASELIREFFITHRP
jgi:polyhydroxybutyrate depolymerase